MPTATAPSRDICRVCRSAAAFPWLGVVADRRVYWRCGVCAATLLDPRQFPTPAAEAAEYRLHRNDPNDLGYRRFLGRLAEPLSAALPAGSRGLDFGCGPGPALAAMLREAGHTVALYDPVFFPDPAPLEDAYDFVTATEVVEHLHRPAEAFDLFDRLLRPGGSLGLTTGFQTDDARFPDWHYRRDATHVTFYRSETLRHVAATRDYAYAEPSKDVAILRKPGG